MFVCVCLSVWLCVCEVACPISICLCNYYYYCIFLNVYTTKLKIKSKKNQLSFKKITIVGVLCIHVHEAGMRPQAQTLTLAFLRPCQELFYILLDNIQSRLYCYIIFVTVVKFQGHSNVRKMTVKSYSLSRVLSSQVPTL